MKKKIVTIICITLVLIFCFFVGLYILGIRSQAYTIAADFLKENKILLENIGPLKDHRLSIFGYSVRDSSSHGHADYKILVKGENGKGSVYIELEKSVGIWKVTQANLVVDNGATISLGRRPVPAN